MVSGILLFLIILVGFGGMAAGITYRRRLGFSGQIRVMSAISLAITILFAVGMIFNVGTTRHNWYILTQGTLLAVVLYGMSRLSKSW